MYNSNTNSLIIVDAHLTKKKGYYVQFISLIDFIHSPSNFALIFFYVKIRVDPTQLDSPATRLK